MGLAGPGSDLSEELVRGCEPVALESESFTPCTPRPVLGRVATAAVSLVAGLALPDLARYADYAGADAEKSGPLGILAGLLPSGNNLGLALAVVEHCLEHDVGEPALDAAHGFHRSFAVGFLAVVVVAPGGLVA